jgi:hypothetical protein
MFMFLLHLAETAAPVLGSPEKKKARTSNMSMVGLTGLAAGCWKSRLLGRNISVLRKSM